MYVRHRFVLRQASRRAIQETPYEFGFGEFGKYIYYSKYSRQRADCPQEAWPDTVIRVIEGVMSLRKDHYYRNRIEWDEAYWQQIAYEMGMSMLRMHWLPPGRGIYHMGMPFVYERGGMALYNCANTVLGRDFANDAHWMMDVLMHGVGAGANPIKTGLKAYSPTGEVDYVVPDSREGWCESTRKKIVSYTRPDQSKIKMHYDLVRPAGSPIKGFGGTASGPEPLIRLHEAIDEFFGNFDSTIKGEHYGEIMLKTDVANMLGVCVVSGNVRRSAEIIVAHLDEVLHLKDYERFPHRASHGWMSNNTAGLRTDRDFNRLGEIANRVLVNGEPGVANLRNFVLGRIGKSEYYVPDKAIGLNPCGEIPLEDKEVCNLAETCPTRCETEEDWFDACRFASLYCSTVSLLPTHRPETNAKIAKNRRIGVSIVGVCDWKTRDGITALTRSLRKGYRIVKQTNADANAEAGVPAAIRVTTVKPGGTVPKLVGAPGGVSPPTFPYTLRRCLESDHGPIGKYLIAAGIPNEPSKHYPNSRVFEFLMEQTASPPAANVSLWEQAATITLLQREWADNAVSNTLYFRPAWPTVQVFKHAKKEELEEEYGITRYGDASGYRVTEEHGSLHLRKYDPHHEENQVEQVLASLVPVTKSLALCPHTPAGVYEQTPETELSEAEFRTRQEAMPLVDWSKLSGSDGQDEKYCTADFCSFGSQS